MILFLFGAKLAQRLLGLVAPVLAQLQNGAIADLDREQAARTTVVLLPHSSIATSSRPFFVGARARPAWQTCPARC